MLFSSITLGCHCDFFKNHKKIQFTFLNFSTCCPHLALCRWSSAVIFSNVILGCHCNDINFKNLFVLFNFPHVVHPQRCAGGFLLGFFPMLTLGCNCDALFCFIKKKRRRKKENQFRL